MKKVLATILAVSTAALAITACNDGNTKNNPSAYEFEVYEAGTVVPHDGVESVVIWAVLFAIAACAVVFTTKKIKA